MSAAESKRPRRAGSRSRSTSSRRSSRPAGSKERQQGRAGRAARGGRARQRRGRGCRGGGAEARPLRRRGARGRGRDAEEKPAHAAAAPPRPQHPPQGAPPREPDGDVVIARAREVRAQRPAQGPPRDEPHPRQAGRAGAGYPRARPRAVTEDILKLLDSAVANAEANHELAPTSFVSAAPTWTRGPPSSATGRARSAGPRRINKRTSHMTIELTTREDGSSQWARRSIPSRCGSATSTTGSRPGSTSRSSRTTCSRTSTSATTSRTSSPTPASRTSRSRRTRTRSRSTSTRPARGS